MNTTSTGQLQEWDIWFALLHNPLYDSPREHPVLIIGEDKPLIIVLAMTSQNETAYADYAISDWYEAGLEKPTVAKLADVYGLEASDFRRRIGQLSSRDKAAILAKIAMLSF